MTKPTLSQVTPLTSSQPTLSPIGRMVWRAMQGCGARPGEVIDARSTMSRGLSQGLRNGDELHQGMRELHDAGLVEYPEGADNATLTEQGFERLTS